MGKPILYPNPVQDGRWVRVTASLCEPIPQVDLQIFTTAYRRVREVALGPMGPGTLDVPLELKDSKGKALANGLYYIRLVAPDEQTIGVLMVLR